MGKIPMVDQDINVDELYSKSITILNNDPSGYSYHFKTCIIHLVDAVSRGTITKGEAYDVLAGNSSNLKTEFFPEHLKVRQSAYSHLI